MESSYFIEIDKLSPTHFYLSQKDLNAAKSYFKSHALEDYPPLPVVCAGGKKLLAGGHATAYYLLTQNKKTLKVYDDKDNQDFLLNIWLLIECEKINVLGIKDLELRILPDDKYESMMTIKLKELNDKLEKDPLCGLRCSEITDGDIKTELADCILTPVPAYFTNEFIYENYIEKIRTMKFLSFAIHEYSVAFVALRPVYDKVLEIYMLGIHPKVEYTDIADRIIKEILSLAESMQKEFVSVKIPAKSAVKNKAYMLYDFYTKHGFTQLESLESPWDEKRLCMLLIRH